MNKIPKPDQDLKEFFKSILPDDPRVAVRPMFGNLAGFVNGNLFTGLYGDDLFVRLTDENRQELLKKKGASVFEPMKGRPMKEYILIPKTWRKEPETVRLWISKSLDWAGKLPQKKKTKR